MSQFTVEEEEGEDEDEKEDEEEDAEEEAEEGEDGEVEEIEEEEEEGGVVVDAASVVVVGAVAATVAVATAAAVGTLEHPPSSPSFPSTTSTIPTTSSSCCCCCSFQDKTATCTGMRTHVMVLNESCSVRPDTRFAAITPRGDMRMAGMPMARAEEEKDRRMERGRMKEGVRESRRERARARVEQWAPRDDAVRRSVKDYSRRVYGGCTARTRSRRVRAPVVKSIASASPYLRLHPAVIPARAISDAAPAWTGVAPTQAEERPGTTT